MNPVSLQVLNKRIAESKLGNKWINDPLINQDIWPIEKLGDFEEESTIHKNRNFYFQDFLLPWLKLLTKLTVKASVRQRHCLGTITMRITCLKQLDKFLVSQGYGQPELINDNILGEFVCQGSQNRKKVINYVVKLWAEEQWLKLEYTSRNYKITTPKIEVIPEEVLFKIYKNFDLFPPPLERLFRLQIVLGSRLGEMLRIPRQCLKQEGDDWFLLRWVEKRKQWKFSQVHPLVVELVKEQQKFLNNHLISEFNFDKLFCKISTAYHEGAKGGKNRFTIEPIYKPEILSISVINQWLRAFSEKADLQDKYGNRFNLKSHQFRRTKASIMAYCGTEDEYIATVLGHSSLDMLPHYRQRSLDRLEKETKTKGYVDMYGQVTAFKPRKRRYEKLAEILKVNTTLGECHRPTMLGDCQYRYACLNCIHHRVSLDDKEKLEIDFQQLQNNLEQAQIANQEKRVTEINRLLELLETRLQGLMQLQYSQGIKRNDSP